MNHVKDDDRVGAVEDLLALYADRIPLHIISQASEIIHSDLHVAIFGQPRQITGLSLGQVDDIAIRPVIPSISKSPRVEKGASRVRLHKIVPTHGLREDKRVKTGS